MNRREGGLLLQLTDVGSIGDVILVVAGSGRSLLGGRRRETRRLDAVRLVGLLLLGSLGGGRSGRVLNADRSHCGCRCGSLGERVKVSRRCRLFWFV